MVYSKLYVVYSKGYIHKDKDPTNRTVSGIPDALAVLYHTNCNIPCYSIPYSIGMIIVFMCPLRPPSTPSGAL